jgi:hypothetical protein
MKPLYTSRLFAAELLVELERGLAQVDPPFDPARLGNWATRKYLAHVGQMEEGLLDKLLTIQLLEDGPEFEMTVDQIRAFAKEML